MRVAHVGKIAEDRYTLSTYPCPMCSDVKTIEITGQQVWKYNQGALIGEVLPDTDLGIREQFLSGYCGTCWDMMFAGLDDEEGED
jgi:hypothetical protein